MGFFSADMEVMLDIFQSETLDLMKEFEKYLINAEKEHTIDSNAANGIFRIVHTIKSSSAMMGLEDMSKCSHKIEDLFFAFRDRPSLLFKTDEIFELLYFYSDYINSEIKKTSQKDYTPFAPVFLQKGLEEAIASILTEKEQEHWSIKIIFKQGAQMENMRAFTLVTKFKTLCESFTYEPPDLNQKEKAELIRQNGFAVCFTKPDKEKIQALLEKSAYVEKWEILSSNEFSDDKSDEKKREENDIKTNLNNQEDTGNSKGQEKNEKYISVHTEQLRKLGNVANELITTNSIMQNAIKQLPDTEELENIERTFNSLLLELTDIARAAVVMPIESIIPQIYRIVRDICKKEGKQVEFRVKGEEIEVDRSILDAMSVALIHLFRNAVDHGIEAPDVRIEKNKPAVGTVRLLISNMGGNVEFRISDDGKGINSKELMKIAKEKKMLQKKEDEYTEDEILNFILIPGFSTKKTVNEYSGRGVGMDAVRDAVMGIGGVMTVKSEVDKGSEFIIQVPVSMTIVESICFCQGEYTCLIPIQNVEVCYSAYSLNELIFEIDGTKYLKQDGMIPLIYLKEVFGEEKETISGKKSQAENDKYIIILTNDTEKAALVVDEIQGERLVLEKPLPYVFRYRYRKATGIMGCSVLENGKIGFMLSAERLIKMKWKGIKGGEGR